MAENMFEKEHSGLESCREVREGKGISLTDLECQAMMVSKMVLPLSVGRLVIKSTAMCDLCHEGMGIEITFLEGSEWGTLDMAHVEQDEMGDGKLLVNFPCVGIKEAGGWQNALCFCGWNLRHIIMIRP